QADVQEEADEEQLLQTPEHVRELLRAAVIGEEHAEHERAELRAQSETGETLAAADREQRAEQHEQLAVSAIVEQPPETAARERQQQQDERERRRRLGRDEREQRDRDDVLHDQDADRDAAVHRAQLAIALEHLRREHGAREAEHQRDQQRRRPRE